MQIVRTMIEGGSVEMTLADKADPTQAKAFVSLRVPVKTDRSRPVAEVQLEALRHTRDAIAAEMKAIQGLQGQKP